MTQPQQESLFTRYMKAFEDSEQHTSSCEPCQNGEECPQGAPLHERFARLQDAYRERQLKQR
ncbi:hypothetical protein [Streptomyces sp. NPDC007856]|uniref:hypothetical protein n=1 Tax=Streptomyces sp. NPDC007856 TaxID=3364781 RepID=UPI0036A897C4